MAQRTALYDFFRNQYIHRMLMRYAAAAAIEENLFTAVEFPIGKQRKQLA